MESPALQVIMQQDLLVLVVHHVSIESDLSVTRETQAGRVGRDVMHGLQAHIEGYAGTSTGPWTLRPGNGAPLSGAYSCDRVRPYARHTQIPLTQYI
eukprot:2082982-Amphidinium_carterae.1